MSSSYTLDQAQKDIANLRGQLVHLAAYTTLLQLIVSTQFTAPDGSIWTSSGLSNDTPNVASNANSWTGTLHYRKYPFGVVIVNGTMGVPVGVGNPSNVNSALAAAYRPTDNMALCAIDNGGSPFAGNAKACDMQTSGVIRVYDAVAGDTVRICGIYDVAF